MGFQSWSKSNLEALKILRPNFGIRTWKDISTTDRNIIWQHLLPYFFEKKPAKSFETYDYYYPFTGDAIEQERKRKRIGFAIYHLNNNFKARNYAPKFLEDGTYFSACADFYDILTTQTEHAAIELLSLYAQAIINEDKYYLNIYRGAGESDESFKKRKEELDWLPFDQFANDINEVFSQFGLNYHLTRLGFAPRVDEKIIDDIYVPVLKVLSNEKWKEVNVYLSESFSEYRKNTPESFGTCIAKAATALQAYLQILVHSNTGAGDISKLIPHAQKKGLIPNDMFTTKTFENLESTIVRARQDTSGVHPRKEFANEKNARFILDLVMVFLQHCLN